MKQVLRDRSNNRIGEITEGSGGVLVIRDRSNNKCGTYDPKRNETRDVHNRLVGKGNLLTTLLPYND